MLILSREENQRIVIRDGRGRLVGYVVMTAFRGGRARIGFEGFEGLTIDREEIDCERMGLPALPTRATWRDMHVQGKRERAIGEREAELFRSVL